jgi:hypothetical protein
MGCKTLGVMAVLSALAATALAAPASAADATPHWRPSTLPLPVGRENAGPRLVAHDGHGGYTAIAGPEIITWRDGQPTEHAAPAGQQPIRVWGESRDDTLLVGTLDNKLLPKLFAMDKTGFHEVPTAQFSYVEWAVVGPHGDILIMADAADGSTSVQHSTLADPTTWQPVAGVTPGSQPVAVDDDGSMLMADPSGSYVLHDGVVHRLAAPAPTDAYQPDGMSIKHGVVVGFGWPTPDGARQPLEWSAPSYAPKVLDGSGGANDVNAHGLVVGLTTDGLPVAWPHGGAATQLPLPTGIAEATPLFVDDDGTIVGDGRGPLNSGVEQVVVWRR